MTRDRRIARDRIRPTRVNVKRMPPAVRRERAAGSFLIAGAAAGLVVMALHPTAHGLMNPDSGGHLARVNVMVHGLALAAMPMVFLGLLGLARRLGATDLTTAALVAYGWGLVAVMSAAVASGFVAPAVIERMAVNDTDSLPDSFLHFTGLLNQGFAKVNAVGSSVGILLFSIAILRGNRLSRASGVFGAVVGVLIPLLIFVGHIRLDVHGFGAVLLAQGLWMLWVGVLLCRD